MPIAPPPDGKVLAEVAAYLYVCKEKRPAFQRCLAAALKEARRGHGIDRGLPRRSPVVKVLERIRRETPTEALALVRKEGANYEAAATFLSCAIVPNEIEEWIVAASPEERYAAVDKAQASSQALPDGGRPPGTPGNPAFDLFVSQLYYFAAYFGGQPGNASRKGSEIVTSKIAGTLNLLRRRGVLPEGFIPAEEGSILNAILRAKSCWENG